MEIAQFIFQFLLPDICMEIASLAIGVICDCQCRGSIITVVISVLGGIVGYLFETLFSAHIFLFTLCSRSGLFILYPKSSIELKDIGTLQAERKMYNVILNKGWSLQRHENDQMDEKCL